MSSLTDTLAEIATIDKEVAALNDKIDGLKSRRARLEELAVEEMTTARFDGIKAAGRAWRVEWTHSFSAPEARKEDVMEAARKAGLLDAVTSVNTARLKALLTERAKEAGTDARDLYSAGTEFEGLVGEFVRPVLRHQTV